MRNPIAKTIDLLFHSDYNKYSVVTSVDMLLHSDYNKCLLLLRIVGYIQMV